MGLEHTIMLDTVVQPHGLFNEPINSHPFSAHTESAPMHLFHVMPHITIPILLASSSLTKPPAYLTGVPTEFETL